MSVRYVPKAGALGTFLLGDAMAGVLMAVGRRVVDRAKQIAPVETGAYRDHLTAEADRHRTRNVVHVGSTVRHAVLVEAKTHTLRRALG